MKVFSHIVIIIVYIEYLLVSQNLNEEISKTIDKPPLCPSATLSASATMEENGFGSKKARSSFGKGFFKIRGGKKTSSNINLGKHVLLDMATVPAEILTCDFFLELVRGVFFTFLGHTRRIFSMAQDCNLQATHPPDSFNYVVPCCGAVCLFVCCF